MSVARKWNFLFSDSFDMFKPLPNIITKTRKILNYYQYSRNAFFDQKAFQNEFLHHFILFCILKYIFTADSLVVNHW